MKSKATTDILRAVILGGILSACSGADRAFENSHGFFDANGPGEGRPEETEKVAPPVSIGGGFLHCEEPSVGSQLDLSNLAYSCGLRNEKGDIKLPASAVLSYRVIGKDNKNIASADIVNIIDEKSFIVFIPFPLKAEFIEVKLSFSGSLDSYSFRYLLKEQQELSFNLGEPGNVFQAGTMFGQTGCTSENAKQVDINNPVWKMNIPKGNYEFTVSFSTCGMSENSGFKLDGNFPSGEGGPIYLLKPDNNNDDQSASHIEQSFRVSGGPLEFYFERAQLVQTTIDSFQISSPKITIRPLD